MHVLILDDDDLNNTILASVLEEIPLIDTISVFNDGWEALQFLEDNKEGSFPDILLLDLKMPMMDGEEFVQNYESRFLDDFPDSKLVALSNSTLNREKDKIVSYQSVTCFMNKPLDIDKLKKFLEEFIQRRDCRDS